MARKTVVADDTHREEQREYRDRLARENRPEVGRVDTAVAAAIYAYLRRIRDEQRDREGKAGGDFLLETALDVLVEMGRERKKLPVPLRPQGFPSGASPPDREGERALRTPSRHA